jgi:hypothetical protein
MEPIIAVVKKKQKEKKTTSLVIQANESHSEVAQSSSTK